MWNKSYFISLSIYLFTFIFGFLALSCGGEDEEYSGCNCPDIPSTPNLIKAGKYLSDEPQPMEFDGKLLPETALFQSIDVFDENIEVVFSDDAGAPFKVIFKILEKINGE